MIGPKYWLFRPEFNKIKNKKKSHNDVIKKIMLIFGGSDPLNFSSYVLNELFQMDLGFNVILVLGAAFRHHDELNVVLDKFKTSKTKVQILENIKNVGELMRENDLVLTSPGLSFFEALLVGTPVVGFHQDENQRLEYSDVFPTMGLSELHKLKNVIKNKVFIYPDEPLVKSMEIGEGEAEVIYEILK